VRGLYNAVSNPSGLHTPPGFGRVANYTRASGDSLGVGVFSTLGSYGIKVTAASTSLLINNVSFEGYADIEAMQYGLYLQGAYNCTFNGAWYLSNQHNVTLATVGTIGSQYNHFGGRLQMNGALAGAYHVTLDGPVPDGQGNLVGGCYDNVFDHPSFSRPHTFAQSVQDAGVRTVWRGTGDSGIPVIPALARAWADNPLPPEVLLTSTIPTTVVHASITPVLTGKLRVTVTGTLYNSGGAVCGAVLSIMVGTTTYYIQGEVSQSAIPSGASASVALCVDLDQVQGPDLPAPFVGTLGTTYEVSVQLTASIPHDIDVPPHGMQLSVQELP
jgi:hypothetical protein